MSPILDLQQRLQEVGRIRMGQQQAYTRKDGSQGRRPAKLQHWRLTSRDQQRLAAAAEHYGGAVQPWEGREGEHELYTTTDTLRVLIIPGQALSQWWELWSGGGCQRRCDGHTEVLTQAPCLCPAAYDERAEAAAEGKACKPCTRLAVLLPDVPGIGHWRLETHSYYAAVELAAATGLLEEATRRGALLPARLRIDVRRKVAGGKTTSYPVPVVDLDVTPTALIELGRGAAEGELLALPPAPAAQGHTPVPAEARAQGAGVAAGVAAMAEPPAPAAPRANAQAALGAAAPLPAPVPVPVGEGEPAPPVQPAPAQVPVPAPGAAPAAPAAPVAAPTPPAAAAAAPGATAALPAMANQRQRRLLWATVRERGLPEDQLRGILRDITGQESTASIPTTLFGAVLATVQATEVAQA